MGGQAAAHLVNEETLRRQPDLGMRSPVPEVDLKWDPVERWKLVSQWEWEIPEHNNILELRTAIATIDRLARRPGDWDTRHLMISDSQATIGALSKGRSSRRTFNSCCRRLLAATVGIGVRAYWRYVRTHRNVADGPSRGQALGNAGTVPILAEPVGCEAWNVLPSVFYLKTRG